VPLNQLQWRILSLIAQNRDPESFVAGGTALNRESARYSDDIDTFNDELERVEQAALADAEALTGAGMDVS
jgi:hypothetical protein